MHICRHFRSISIAFLSLSLAFFLSLTLSHSHSLPRVVLHSHPSSAPPIPFPSLSLILIIRNRNSVCTIRLPSSASPHVIFPLIMPSAPLLRHPLHLLAPPARLVNVFTRSSLPLTIAGSARIISIKHVVSSAQRPCFVPCGSQPAGPRAEFESFASHSV